MCEKLFFKINESTYSFIFLFLKEYPSVFHKSRLSEKAKHICVGVAVSL